MSSAVGQEKKAWEEATWDSLPGLEETPRRRQVGGGCESRSTSTSSVSLSNANGCAVALGAQKDVDSKTPLSVVIFGATGDLAKKKLFPALYQLMYGCPDAPLIPVEARIVGYGRSHVELDAFLAKQCANIKGPHRDAFLKSISYCQGSYNDANDFAKLDSMLCGFEDGQGGSRLFFLSVPPTIFGCVCENIHRRARATRGYTRLIIEKPFGRDSRSFAELHDMTLRCFDEEQLFRIDHYLAKEAVLNMVAFRFANQLYEPLWDRNHIAQVQIIWKEALGTDGRGGYFDEFGIIRDMMQTHLLQVFMWLAMEPPKRLDARSISREKRRLLQATRTLDMDDCLLGQFTGNSWVTPDGVERTESGYLDDSTVPDGSRCPTFAAVVLSVDNDRWRDVPFLVSAGKGLDESIAEVRIMFRRQAYNDLVPSQPNELVLRIQPDPSIYLNTTVKRPGWAQDQVAHVNLDMTYKNSFPGTYVAEAYERMFLQASKGDRSLFVGADELVESWRIFTPLLDTIDREKPEPVLYPFGCTAPEGMVSFARERGVLVDAAEAAPAPPAPEVNDAPCSFLESMVRGKSKPREATPPREWLKMQGA